MGYCSTASGSFEIRPPLNSRELRELPDISQPYGDEIEVVVTEHRTENEDGSETIRRTGTAVVPKSPESEWKRYYTDKQLQVLVTAFSDHEFSGYFEFLGEDGERWRHVVKDREVVKIKPELIWPDCNYLRRHLDNQDKLVLNRRELT